MLERGSVIALPLLLFVPLHAQKSELQREPTLLYPRDSSRLRIGLHLALGAQSSAFDAVWSQNKAVHAIRLADELIAKNRHSFLGHAVKYLAELELRRDRKADESVSRADDRSLSGKETLGVFALHTTALGGEPRREKTTGQGDGGGEQKSAERVHEASGVSFWKTKR